MGLEAQIEAMIRKAVADGVAEGTSRVLAQLEGRREGGPSSDEVEPDDEVDTPTAARLAHVKPRTITNWVRRGWLTPITKGRSYIFRAGDVRSVARDRRGPRKVLSLHHRAQKILKGRP